MRVYNPSSFRNQRFAKGLVAGLGSAIVLAIVYAFITNLIHIQFSILYIGVGYIIGQSILNIGHGVKQKFKILGAVCAIIFILLADSLMMSGFNLQYYPEIFIYVLRSYASISINNLLGLLFRAACIYYAYINSTVV